MFNPLDWNMTRVWTDIPSIHQSSLSAHPFCLHVQQNQGGEEKEKDSGTPVRDTDSQYGTWETGLRSDDR